MYADQLELLFHLFKREQILVVRTEEALPALAHKPALVCWAMRDFLLKPVYLEEWKRLWPQAEVREFALQLAWSLVREHDAKAIVVACNTAASVALTDLQAELAKDRVDAPPLAGGRRATSSPSASGRVARSVPRSTSAPLRPTRRCARSTASSDRDAKKVSSSPAIVASPGSSISIRSAPSRERRMAKRRTPMRMR